MPVPISPPFSHEKSHSDRDPMRALMLSPSWLVSSVPLSVKINPPSTSYSNSSPRMSGLLKPRSTKTPHDSDAFLRSTINNNTCRRDIKRK